MNPEFACVQLHCRAFVRIWPTVFIHCLTNQFLAQNAHWYISTFAFIFEGPPGLNGVGTPGEEGPRGAQGPQGNVGPPGPRGLTGPQGYCRTCPLHYPIIAPPPQYVNKGPRTRR